MSGVGLAEGAGDQFYVTHCAPADSVRNDSGYSVRAASAGDSAVLDAAFHYPPYELPFEMWKDLPPATIAPRRLALTPHSKGGVWVVHSSYLAKDTVDRDRSFFSHLMLFPSASPAAVLRSWGATEWVTSYPPGAPKALPRARLPVGSLIGDAPLSAFLSERPPWPTDAVSAVCPPRLRDSTAGRRELLARALHAVQLLAVQKTEARRRLFIHAEPALVAMLLYGCVRLLPSAATTGLTFSTYEPAHRNIRNYRLARVVGTYTGPAGKALDAELGTTQGITLDTFVPVRSSAELSWQLPPELAGLVEIAAGGQWNRLAAAQGAVVGEEDDAWINEAIAEARTHLPAGDPNLALKAPTISGSRPAAVRQVIGSYSAQISRTNPACLLFLIDQSGSMAEPFVGGGASKAATVADAVNRLLQNVVLRSAKADGVRDYFRVGIIGYGASIRAGLGGTVPFNVLLPVSQLGEYPLRVDTRTKLTPDGMGGVVEQSVKFPVWFDPETGGNTPMCAALAAAGLAVQGFVEEFPNAYPPIVLNLTDGMPSDGNPQEVAKRIRNLGTTDGNALLFNLLISKIPVPPAYFPADENGFTENTAKLLFRMSSVLPPKLWSAARNEGHDLKPNARGVVLNADPTAIVRFLDIGTRVTPAGAPADPT